VVSGGTVGGRPVGRTVALRRVRCSELAQKAVEVRLRRKIGKLDGPIDDRYFWIVGPLRSVGCGLSAIGTISLSEAPCKPANRCENLDLNPRSFKSD
jgi:hypothetical protein